jgi:hypothetical protein
MEYLKRKGTSYIFFMLREKPLSEEFGLCTSEEFAISKAYMSQKISYYLKIIHSHFAGFVVRKIIVVHQSKQKAVFTLIKHPRSKWIKTV